MNRKKRMSRKKLTLASLVAIPVVAGLAFAVTGSALAADNGQELVLCQGGTDYQAALVEGMNQNGEPSREEVNLRSGGCKILTDFWWKGQVTIEWRYPITPGTPTVTSTCNVPDDQRPDTYACFPPQ